MKPALKLDLNDTDDICVLGIQSPLTIMQLAYFLNKSNAFRFRKVPQDYQLNIDKNTAASYTHYRDERDHRVYYLINNFALEQESQRENELFSVPKRHALIDKKTDAWLCWEDDGSPTHEMIHLIQKAVPHTHCFHAQSLSNKHNKRLAWLFYD